MGLLQATSTNIISMVGVGPFLTIPFMIQAMNGPHILYAWIAGAVLALADGLVYAQLGAALPGSGGGYLYLREAFQPFGLGRLMGFLFIFQTILVAPLSIAGGAVGFSDYLQFVWTTMTPVQHHLLAATVCVAMAALLWRDIESIGRLAVVMLVGVLVTVGWVIVVGLFTFSPSMAFDFPPQAYAFDASLAAALGAASVLAMYSYGGYNQVCNIGEEIVDPGRTVPRSIVVSIVIVAALYMAMTIVVLGLIPWQEAAGLRTIASEFIVRTFADPGSRAHRRNRDDRTHPVRGRRIALRHHPGLLAHPVRGGARWRLLRRVRQGPPDQALPPCLAGRHHPDLAAVLLLHARPAGELADSGADPPALHLAVRGGDPAAALPPGHPSTVHDVAVPAAGALSLALWLYIFFTGPREGIVFSVRVPRGLGGRLLCLRAAEKGTCGTARQGLDPCAQAGLAATDDLGQLLPRPRE